MTRLRGSLEHVCVALRVAVGRDVGADGARPRAAAGADPAARAPHDGAPPDRTPWPPTGGDGAEAARSDVGSPGPSRTRATA
ncbi:MAG: hypothetical protein JNM10_06410 [Planctomycetia bacterium]|nr:hypothetical protein [Planctomycetia bacterium]